MDNVQDNVHSIECSLSDNRLAYAVYQPDKVLDIVQGFVHAHTP